MKILAFLSLIYILVLAAIGVGKLQKKNNYDRCVSVVSAAVATGKFPKDTNIKEKCLYHLE